MKILLLACAAAGLAAGPTWPKPTVIDYSLVVDAADLANISVVMRIHGAPGDFRVAMVAHPEYDDGYWRYLTDLRGESSVAGAVTIVREDSAVWHVTAPAGDVTLRYRVRYPTSAPGQQAAWKAHLTAAGGLIGGPHSFLYVVGAEHAPVRATVTMPDGWTIVTGLDSVPGAIAPAHSTTFSANGIESLVDSPMLVGPVRHWTFAINGVTHGVSYLGGAGGASFDTARFISGIERYARQTVAMFGRMPYRRYEFLFEDGAFGALEHTNSVSFGAPSTQLARDPDYMIGTVAHEFFHTWNEVHLRPATWIGVRHAAPAPTGELWWSEGVTLYYADVLRRRAGLPTPDSTRAAHLAHLVELWIANPSHGAVAAERVSRAFNLPTGTLGDYTASMYTQGEVLGAMLDLMIRERTGGTRSLDDAMRTMSASFSMTHGFTRGDIERAVHDACACDAGNFFHAFVEGPIGADLPHFFTSRGFSVSVSSTRALDNNGAPAPDLRFSAYGSAGGPALLNVWYPTWPLARAGFHTGDTLRSLNGAPVTDVAAFRAAVERLHVGDSLRLVATHAGTKVDRTIVIAGYDRPVVTVAIGTDASPAQRKVLEAWMAGR